MFSPLLRKLEHLKPQSICVEAAHIYANEIPGKEHFFCASLGARVSETLTQNGFNPVKVLFVDDYHPSFHEKTLNLPEYVKRLREEGFEPDEVVMESTLEKPAFCISRSLIGRTEMKDGKLQLCKPKLDLMSEDGVISCNLLDAAFYAYKFRRFDFSVTVLPDAYKGQQRNVRKLLKALGHEHLPIANIYHSADLEVTVGVQC